MPIFAEESSIGFLLIWTICLIITIICIVLSKKNNKKYIFRFSIIFSIIGTMIGISYVKIILINYKSELITVGNEIDNYHQNKEKYSYSKIEEIINKHDKPYLVWHTITDDYYRISSYVNIGGILYISYDSKDKKFSKVFFPFTPYNCVEKIWD
jgi:hypothetical protein